LSIFSTFNIEIYFGVFYYELMSLRKLILIDIFLGIFIILVGGSLLGNYFYIQGERWNLKFIPKSLLIRKNEKGINFFQATGVVKDINHENVILEINKKEKLKMFFQGELHIQLYLKENNEIKIKKIENFLLKDLLGKEVAVVGIEIKKNFLATQFKILKIILFSEEIKERPNLLDFISVSKQKQ